MFDTYKPSSGWEMGAREFRDASRARRAAFMFRKSAGWAFDGTILGVPIIAAQAAGAQRGEVVPTLISGTTSLATQPLIMSTIASGLALIPGIGQGAALGLAFVGSLFPAAAVDSGINRAVRTFSRFGKEVHRLEMGGDFQDSTSAAQLRMRGIEDMNAAMISSRRYLGQEARLLHR
jgi:hypothetical protein